MILNSDHSLNVKDRDGERFQNPLAPLPALWNYVLVRFADPRPFLVSAVDFDLSYAVNHDKPHNSSVAQLVTGCASPICQQQFIQIHKWRSFFTPEVFAAALKRFHDRQSDLKAVLSEAELSSEDKLVYMDLIANFFRAAELSANTPVLTKSTPLYRDEYLRREWPNVFAPLDFLIDSWIRGQRAHSSLSSTLEMGHSPILSHWKTARVRFGCRIRRWKVRPVTEKQLQTSPMSSPDRPKQSLFDPIEHFRVVR